MLQPKETELKTSAKEEETKATQIAANLGTSLTNAISSSSNSSQKPAVAGASESDTRDQKKVEAVIYCLRRLATPPRLFRSILDDSEKVNHEYLPEDKAVIPEYLRVHLLEELPEGSTVSIIRNPAKVNAEMLERVYDHNKRVMERQPDATAILSPEGKLLHVVLNPNKVFTL